jgi:hypothetical protein
MIQLVCGSGREGAILTLGAILDWNVRRDLLSCSRANPSVGAEP